MTAIQTAFAALEMAIRIRTESEGHKEVFKGLRAAMQHAIRKKWISDDGLPMPSRPTSFRVSSEGILEEFEPPIVRSYVEVLAEFMPKIRNELAILNKLAATFRSPHHQLLTLSVFHIAPSLK